MPSPRPLRVLFAAAPGSAGGLESVLLELAGGLRRSGHEIGLLAVVDAGVEQHPVSEHATRLGIEVHEVPVPARAYWQEYRKFRSVIRAFKPDIVHTHGYRADLVGGLVARNLRLPWVSTVHGFTGGDRKNRFYEWLQVRAYRRAQAVVAVSRPLRDRLLGSGVPDRHVHHITNAWAPRKLSTRAEARERLGVRGEGPVIGWVGRLSHEKGADLFLEALALLPDHPWQASIIGDGRERHALEAQAARLGIGARVQWHGLVADAASLYSAFDLWVLSSRTEGTPMALFEAMAARVPAVVTSVGGVPDVVSGSEALLVEAELPGPLASAIESILVDQHRARGRADAAYARLVAAFGLDPWLSAHISLYRDIEPTDRPALDD